MTKTAEQERDEAFEYHRERMKEWNERRAIAEYNALQRFNNYRFTFYRPMTTANTTKTYLP
jgi:hypothetical protein